MKFIDILGLSLGNLWRRKWRTVLTVTGVFIGTISVVIMISLGFGLKDSLTKEIESYGTMNDIMVTYNGSDKNMYLTDQKIEEFMQLDFVEGVSPELASMTYLNQGKWEMVCSVIGVSQEELEKIPVGQGKTPDCSAGNLELIIGNQVITEAYDKNTYEYIYWTTGELPDVDFLGETVYTRFPSEDTYKIDEYGNVIDTSKKKIIPIVGMVEGGLNDYGKYSYGAYTEINALKSYMEKMYRDSRIPGQPLDKNRNKLNYWVYNMITIHIDDADNVKDAVRYFRELGYQVESNADWLKQTNSIILIAQCVLGGIGGIALFVAAIGITNTITMSIYERRKEIGIMKVLGCDLSDIGGMFLGEAAFIGFLGGVFGVGVSYGLSYFVNLFLGPVIAQEMQINITLSVIPSWLSLVAIGFATIVGMLAGYFPSKKAIKMSPLVAIRNE